MSRMVTPQTGFGSIMGSSGANVMPQQSSQAVNNPSFRERVARRAYEKWLQRGCRHGCDKQDWLEAERELLAEQTRQGNTSVGYQR